MKLFVSGIGTDVGKTVVSAILTEAFQADYWKPVQSGDLHFTDSDKVRSFVKNTKSKFHKEIYRLNTPASPHYAAEVDGVEINLENFVLPETENHLIVEGAGGLMVPLNSNQTVLDLIKKLNIPVVLVSRNYLGSINHTMLSIEMLKARNVEVKGIIFNGEPNPATESWILKNSGLPFIASVPMSESPVDVNFVSKTAEELRSNLERILV